jgi:PAS domain S-box-containing protein
VVLSALPSAALARQKKHVLVLNSYHPGYAWSDGVMAAVRSVFERTEFDVNLRIEHMDTKHHKPERVFPHLERLYREKYANSAFDVIIASDNNALDFLLKRRGDLFAAVPIVFCGINDFDESMIAGIDEITGVVEDNDFHGTVELALRLHPETRRIVALSDTTATGRVDLQRFRRVAAAFYGVVEFTELFDLTTEELIAALHALPEDTVVIHLSFYMDRAGRTYGPAESVAIVAENCDVPVYTMWEDRLGTHGMGGVITSSALQGRNAARMALRILRGEPAGAIAVLRQCPTQPVLNFPQMQRFGIEESDLPPGTVVINKPFSLYETYKGLMWAVAGAFAVLMFFTAVLSVSTVRRRRAEAALRESEEKHRSLVEHSNDGICIGQDRVVKYANEQLARILGRCATEVIGKPIDRFVHPDELAKVYRAYERLLSGQDQEQRFETAVLHRDGHRIEVDLNVSAVSYEGRLAGLVFVRDITDRKRMERQLEKERATLEKIISLNPYSIAIYDADGRFVKTNRSFRELFAAALPDSYCLFDDPILAGSGYSTAVHRLKQGEVLEIPGLWYTSRPADSPEADKSVYIRAVAFPIMDQNDELEYVVSMLEDITDRKRNEEQRRRLEAQMQHAQKLESLGVLAGGIAHDFNNILVSILGHAELALRDLPDGSPARKGFDEIRAAAIRAAELTNQMLAYSGRGRFVIKAVNLNELVREMAHLLAASVSKKARLVYDFADDLPAVEVDVVQMRQVVMNLIINASEAIGDRSGVIAVSTGAAHVQPGMLADTCAAEALPEGDCVYLEVSDTGAGLDEKTKARMFEPFFTTKFAGRGLGLAAVLGIVRGHGGAIQVESDPGKGSTFKVLLPCSDKRAEPVAVARGGADAEHWDGNGTILVVDDEAGVRSLAKAVLERHGFTVLTASDGAKGVRTFRNHADQITAVLLDMTMPRAGGEEAFQEMRRIRPDLPVILVSGYDEQDATHRFAGQGLAGFVQKPFQIDVLSRKLHEVLQLRGQASATL